MLDGFRMYSVREKSSSRLFSSGKKSVVMGSKAGISSDFQSTPAIADSFMKSVEESDWLVELVAEAPDWLEAWGWGFLVTGKMCVQRRRLMVTLDSVWLVSNGFNKTLLGRSKMLLIF